MAESFSLTEIRGDLFSTASAESLAHCISKDCRLGAGIAKLFKQKFGRITELKQMGTDVGGVSPIRLSPFGGRYVYHLVTKEKYFHKPSYESLRSSLVAMRDHATKNDIKRISMPKLGCGLDKLEWPKVLDIIHEVFTETTLQIKVYVL